MWKWMEAGLEKDKGCLLRGELRSQHCSLIFSVPTGFTATFWIICIKTFINREATERCELLLHADWLRGVLHWAFCMQVQIS